MKKPSFKVSFGWLSKIPSLLPKKQSGQSAGAKTPEALATRRRRLQWGVACACYSVALNIGMYAGIGWTYPSTETMHFREEVSTLLRIQSHLAKQDTKAAPTMDSIRDVMFGQKTYGAELRTKAEAMLREREKIGLDNELAGIVEKSLQQWRDAEKRLTRDRVVYLSGFLTISLGFPALLFLLGLPGYRKVADKVSARLSKRKADKKAAGDRQRQLMASRAKENLMRKAGAKPSVPDDKMAS